MIVAETRTFELGPFTVQQRPRFDNPAFAVFIIMRGTRVIGKQFSMPIITDCEWLERQRSEEFRYAESSADSQCKGIKGKGYRLIGLAKARAFSLSKRHFKRTTTVLLKLKEEVS